MRLLEFWVALIIAVFSVVSLAQNSAVEITGFADFFYEAQHGEDRPDDFNFGQVELDIETLIEEKVAISAAIAFDAETETFGLGAFTIEIPLIGTDGPHFRRGGLDHTGIIVGQFDVPFGLDWKVYPSIDRKMVTAPLIVDYTHDSWNDLGVQGIVRHDRFELSVMLTNGFDFEVGYGNAGTFVGYNGIGYDSESPVITVSTVETKMAMGGRLGIQAHDYLALGLSYAQFLNHDDKIDMTLMGADVQFDYLDFHAKAEYIAHGLGLSGSNEVTNTGLYIQCLYDFGQESNIWNRKRRTLHPAFLFDETLTLRICR
jgi:hypothetical protein